VKTKLLELVGGEIILIRIQMNTRFILNSREDNEIKEHRMVNHSKLGKVGAYLIFTSFFSDEGSIFNKNFLIRL